MDLSSFSHNQLIRLLANEPRNNDAWIEFIRRYENYLGSVILRECRKLRYDRGVSNLEDLIQDVYVKLFKNSGEAFQTYKGQYENTIWQFLEIVAIRVVYNDQRRTNARKRPHITRDIAQNRTEDILNLFPDKNAADEINRIMMVLAIEECFKCLGKKLRQGARDIRIFKLYLYDGMNAESIAALPEISLSPQSVFRIIADVKNRLGNCLNAEE